MHKNNSIITISHEKGLFPTFETIRIDQKTKINVCSLAMHSYILESFINQSLGENSFNNYDGLIMEYETQNEDYWKKN